MSEIRIARFDDPPGTYRIFSNYFSQALRESAKATPGMRWDPSAVSWVGYPDAIEIVCRSLKERGVGYSGLKAMREQALSTQHELPAAYKGLRPYQNEGLDFLISHGASGVLLADDLGVGKSAQAVRALRAFRKKAVIVCLAQAVGVWAGNAYMESQVEKWWPLVQREGSMVHLEGTSLPKHEWRVVHQGKRRFGGTIERINARWRGTPKEHDETYWWCSRCGQETLYTVLKPDDVGCSFGLPRPSTRVVVVHYDILPYWVDYLLNVWGCTTVILDELHEIVGEKARRTKAVIQLARGCDVRIGLTGTPMANRPRSLFRTVDILCPGRFGAGPFDYWKHYCAGFQKQVSLEKLVWDFSGISNEEELHKRLRFFMLRRVKSEVQKYLPPLIREIIDIKIPAKACLNVDLSVLKRSAVARQALALSADAKFPTIVEAIGRHVRAGRKVIAFSYRKLVAEHIADQIRALGLPSSFINGDVPQKERDRRIGNCKNHGSGYALACTLDTCSTSIDLSFASVACYAELTYEPFVIVQSEGRLHRHGQQNTVTLEYYIGRGSIDDLIAQAIISKLDTFETVIGQTGSTLSRDLDSLPKGRAALDALYETLAAQGKVA